MTMDAAALQATLEELGAEYTKRLGLRVKTAAPGEVTLTLPVTPELIHGGGVVCGQAILAAAHFPREGHSAAAYGAGMLPEAICSLLGAAA